MTVDEKKDPSIGAAWVDVIPGLAMAVIAGAGSFLLWIGWIRESWITGTKYQKLTLWLIVAAFGLLWAIHEYLELRAQRVGTSRAQWQFEVFGTIFVGAVFLIVSVGASFLIAAMLMVVSGTGGSMALATGGVMAGMALLILAVYQYVRTRWKDTDAMAPLTAAVLLVLAPVTFLAFAAFISFFLVFAITMGVAALDHHDLAKSIEESFGLSVGAAMLTMFAAIIGIYLQRRGTTTVSRDNFSVLSRATGLVLFAAMIITFGGLGILTVVVMLKVH